MEGPIKKSGNFIPKMFRVFTLYIFVTLSVFFGYVQIFGGVKPSVITLPTDPTNAEEESYFGNFVNNIMEVQNVYVEGFSLAFVDNENTFNLSATGDVVYDIPTGNLSLDIDLIYNGSVFDVGAVYVAPDLYLTIENCTYKFDMTSNASGNLDLSGVIDFISKNVNIDMSFLDEVGEYLGLDLTNLDLNALQAQLKIDQRVVKNEETEEVLGYEFVVGLGNVVSAQIICDADYGITQVKVKDILIKGNSIKFSAPKVQMNNAENVNKIQIPSDENVVDMTGLTEYAGYAQNLFVNDFVQVDLNFAYNEQNYSGKLYLDSSDNMKALFETNVEGFDIVAGFVDEKVYLDVEGLKLSFDLNDYSKWEDKINEIFVNQTSKTVAEFIEYLIEQKTNVDVENVDLQSSLLSILGNAFANSEKINTYLPDDSLQTEISFVMMWNSGLNITLEKSQDLLSSVVVSYKDITFTADFEIGQSGVEIVGDFYDVTNLLPLADVVDEVLTAKQFGGKVVVVYQDKEIEADFVVDFSNEIIFKANIELFGEKVEIYVTEEKVYAVLGGVVVEGSLSDIENYIAKIDSMFGTNVSENVSFDSMQSVQMNEILAQVSQILNELKLYAEDGSFAVIEYLTNKVALSVSENVLNVLVQSEEISVKLQIFASQKDVVLPQATDNIDRLLNKVESLKEYVESNEFAFEFVLNYNEINLAGNVAIDLNNNIFEISNVEIGQNLLTVRYADKVVYVDYAGMKLKFAVENVEQLIAIIMPIVEANIEMQETNVTAILEQVFGEDVTALTIEELLAKLSLSVSGSLDNLNLAVDFNSENLVKAGIVVTFENDNLKSVEIESQGIRASLQVVAFTLGEIVSEEYYNLTSTHAGQIEVIYNAGSEEVSFTANVEIDLTDKVYVNISTEICDLEVSIIVLNDQMFVKVGEIIVAGEFNNAKELVEKVLNIFAIAMPESNLNVEEILNTLDLNSINPLENVNILVNGEKIEAKFVENDKLTVSMTLKDEQTIGEIVLPQATDNIDSLLNKVESVKNYIDKGVYEFEFNVEYNGLDFAGVLKISDQIVEISEMIVAGENVYIRIQNNVVYIAYGNMKLKFDAQSSNTVENENTSYKEIIDKLLSDAFGVKIEFGVFEELLVMLRDYDLNDYLTKVIVQLSGNTDNLELSLKHKNDMTISQILQANVIFEEDNLSEVNFKLYNSLSGNVKIRYVEESTIRPFVEEEYEDYSTDFVDGVLNSLKVAEDVYAFSSDIAIRYSNTNFYGKLTAMLVEDQSKTTLLGHYVPAVSIYTTSLGLKTYIYLIDESVYIDINGLQLTADLNETTIDEVLTFVENNFGVSLIDSQTAEVTTEAFKVILPAIDQIYGSWVTLLENEMSYNGVQINMNDDLWYSSTSRFYDIVVQAFIENYQNTIVPTKVVLGANIDDPNTVVYDDYSNYWLTNGVDANGDAIVLEDDITKNLNFAVYFTDITVGSFVEGLDEIFVSENGSYKDISAVKSNVGTTNLTDFNSYKTLLEFVETVYDYAMSFEYQMNVNGQISGATTTALDADVIVNVGDLSEGEQNESGFELFDGKYLKVQANMDIVADLGGSEQTQHLIDLLYESNDSSAIYATYTHGEHISAGNKFRAKINNANLSEIISMVLNFADIDLGESVTEALSLQPNTTDFTYLQSILGIGATDVSDEISQVDQILSSVESATKIIEGLSLTKTEIGTNLYQTTLSVKLALDGGTAVVSIIARDELQADGVTIKNNLREIKLENFAMGDSSLNVTIAIEDFDSSNFDYDKTAEHIDFSELSSFVDVTVSTINTRGFNFSGSADVSIIGIDAITVEYDLLVTLDEKGELYLYMEIKVPSFVDVTYNAGGFGNTYSIYSAYGFDKRISILEYKDGVLDLTQNNYGNRYTGWAAWEKRDELDSHPEATWTKDELGSNMMKILAYALGLTDTVYDSIAGLIANMNPNPSLEKTILGFGVTENGYTLSLDGETLTGDSNFGDMNIVIGTSKAYSHNGKDNKFIDSVSTTIDISNGTLKIPVNLQSNSGTTKTTFSGVDLHTNEYYREIYAYQIHSVQFEENGGEHVADIVKSAGEIIELPSLNDYITDDGTVKITYTFDGWWTTADFKAGTQFTSNEMPNEDVVLYAKWNEYKVYYRTMTFETNSSYSADSVTTLEGDMIELPTFETYVVDDGITKTTRVFAGWWTTENFEEGTEFNSNVMPSADTTLYAKWNDTIEYYRTISFQTNCDITFESITKLEGEEISIPTLTTKEETEGNTTTYYQFDGWYVDENYQTAFNLSVMPTQNVTLYAKWKVTKVEKTYALTVYDNGETVYTARVKAGDVIDFSSFEKVNKETKFYLDANYTNEVTDLTMPENDLELHIRNKYNLSYTYYTLQNNTYVQTTYSASLYQGETFSLASQNNTHIDYYNSNGELAYRTYFTFGDYVWNNQVVTSNIMPNYDFTFGNTMTTETKNYYKVVFDVRQYRTSAMVAGYSWKTSASFTPETLYLLEGETINLNQSAYQPTCTGYLTAIKIDLKTFKATSWGLSAWGNGTSGGSGFTSYTVSGSDAGSDGYTITLYACWEKQ